MRLNKTIKTQVARSLTEAATEKARKKVQARLQKVNDQYIGVVDEAISKVADLPKETWSRMAIAGMLALEGEYVPMYRKEEINSLSSFPLGLSFQEKTMYTSGGDPDLVEVRSWASFQWMSDYFGHRSNLNQRLRFLAGRSRPRLNHTPEVTGRLKDDILSAVREVRNLLVEAADFYGETMDVLNSCNTSAQLEKTLPEAMEHLPPQARKSKQVIPTETVESVRNRLKQGVPPKVANA